MVDANIPNVSGMLMALPEIYRERKAARERKDTLADLDINDNDSLASAARRLIQTGNPDNMKLGLQLDQMVRANRDQQMGIDAAHGTSEFIERGGPAVTPPPIEGPYRLPTPGIRSDVSPTPAVGSNPPMNRPRVQPGPLPEIQPTSRNWGTREAEAEGLYEPTSSQAPVESASPPAQTEVQRRQRELSLPSPEEQDLDVKLRGAMRRQAIHDATKRPSKALDTYIKDLQDKKAALQKQRLEDRSKERGFELDVRKEGVSKDIGAFYKQDEDITTKATNSANSINQLNQISDILQSGKTETGPTAQVQARIYNRLIDAGNTLQRLGIIKDANQFETLKNMKDFTGGLQRLESLMVENVFAKLGGFGKNITDQDRQEMYKTVTKLEGTLEGNLLTVNIARKVAESEVQLAEKVNAYKARQERAGQPPSTVALGNIRQAHERQFGRELAGFVKAEEARIRREGVPRSSWRPGIERDVDKITKEGARLIDYGVRRLSNPTDTFDERFRGDR